VIYESFHHIVLRKWSRFGPSWKGSHWVDQWFRVELGASLGEAKPSKEVAP